MPATVRVEQYHPPYGHDRVTPPDDLVGDVFDYLFNTTRWKSDPDQLKRKVVGWRQRLGAARKTQTAPAPLTLAVEAADEAPANAEAMIRALVEVEWMREACVLRVRDRLGYEKIGQQVGKSKNAVRKAVTETLDALGIENPAAPGTVLADGSVVE